MNPQIPGKMCTCQREPPVQRPTPLGAEGCLVCFRNGQEANEATAQWEVGHLGWWGVVADGVGSCWPFLGLNLLSEMGSPVGFSADTGQDLADI